MSEEIVFPSTGGISVSVGEDVVRLTQDDPMGGDASIVDVPVALFPLVLAKIFDRLNLRALTAIRAELDEAERHIPGDR